MTCAQNRHILTVHCYNGATEVIGLLHYIG